MQAKFEFCGNALKIFDFFHSVGDAKAGNPYNTTFGMSVASDGFSGVGEWECDIKNFSRFVTKLEEMEQFQVRQVDFADMGHGSYINFEMDQTGHILVSGTLYGTAMIQQLTFKFTGDQTALAPFNKELKALLPI